MADSDDAARPDFTQGIAIGALQDGGMLLRRAGGEEVLLARAGDELFAVGARCTHYHAPLVDGLVVGDTVRCPWHHACFDLRTGEAVRAPAFDPLACWSVEQRDDQIIVREKQDAPAAIPRARIATKAPDKIVIVGGGAAGFAA